MQLLNVLPLVPTCNIVGTFFDISFFPMSDIKMNLTIILPGGVMMSEQECSKQLKKPVLNTKGRYVGKQKRDREGNPVFETVTVPDLDKMTHHGIRISYKDEETKKTMQEWLNFYTRKCKPAKQVLNISSEAYEYFVSFEVPEGFRPPADFRPNKTLLLRKGISRTKQAWMAMSDKSRLEWHLNRICKSRGGTLGEYKVFND